MDVAALILWILTAGGGFVLLATWIAKGGHRGGANSRFPVPLIFGHFLLAAVGLVLWIIYVAADSDGIGWTAFVLLAIVALMGFTMLAQWIPTFQANRGAGGAAQPVGADAGPAERHFPVLIVAGHGLLAATTLVLVLLTMVGVGGS